MWLKAHSFVGMKEIVTAYSSITLFIDLLLLRPALNKSESAFDYTGRKLTEAYEKAEVEETPSTAFIKIPVCYDKECGPDLDFISNEKEISVEEIIAIHTSRIYRVYMIGFLPGFAYMGKIDERIQVPRKKQPRQKVEKGSVGIAGMQTGVYPLESPGGWQLIGRTPFSLFNPQQEQVLPLAAGSQVQFFSISFQEYQLLS
jgi:inhibitor of KinA